MSEVKTINDTQPVNKLFKLLNNDYRIIHHFLFWSFYIFVQYLNVYARQDDFSSLSLYVAFDVVAVYINLYILLPKLLLQNKGFRYVLSLFALIVLNVAGPHLLGILTGIDTHSCYSCGDKTLLYKISLAFSDTLYISLIQGTAAGLKLFKIWIRNQEKIRCLETENLKTELAYLKNQMNPHFLFNTLNNIYIQIKVDSLKAEKTILDLSDLLRYQLYDCSQEKILLSDDINYLKNYLRIELIRKSKVKIDFIEPENLKRILIPPFLFIPFVENAIKHGGSEENEDYIKVSISIKNNYLYLEVINSKDNRNLNSDTIQGGVGLANVKRRLELLYPNSHKLTIIDETDKYQVNLELKFTN